MLIFRVFSVIAFVLLNSCANSPAKSNGQGESVAPVKIAESEGKTQQKEPKTSIDPDVLFMLLTAELAGQRGQYDIALEGYMEAAKRVHDPRFAERAATIALYMKDSKKANEAVGLWLRQEPGNQTARKIAALSALRAGNKQAAAGHLDLLLKTDSAGFENAVLELAGVLQKDNKEALLYDVLERLLLKHPDNADIYFMQSLLAMQMKNKNLAEKNIQQVLKLKPDWDKALIFQAQIAAFSGDLNRAKALLTETANKYPDNVKIKKLLAQVLIKAEDYQEAGKVYQSMMLADPKDIESQFALGLVHLQLEQDDQAEEIFKKLLEQPDWQYQASFYLGKIEEKKGNTEKALAWFDKVKDGPLVFDASLSAISVLAKDKRYYEANSRLVTLQAQFPKQKLRIMLIQAELYSQQKQYQQAFNLLTKALADSPDQKELLYTRALIAEHIGKSDVVESDLKKILVQQPDNVEALNALGYTLLNKPERYAEAEKYLQRALGLQPDEAVIIDSYGWLQFKLGHIQKAVEYLQKAYQKQQESEIAAHLAEALWASGRKDEARELFNKAIRNSPQDEYLLDFQRRILNGKQ
ncbi:MAG: tetratricopeptide repeat protein [Methylococcales bacterium]|nr:tetratricopeptide repeat protein [Methylococcales bacterium]